MTTMRGEGGRLWMRSRHGRDERLLDIARETLQSDAGIPADQ